MSAAQLFGKSVNSFGIYQWCTWQTLDCAVPKFHIRARLRGVYVGICLQVCRELLYLPPLAALLVG